VILLASLYRRIGHRPRFVLNELSPPAVRFLRAFPHMRLCDRALGNAPNWRSSQHYARLQSKIRWGAVPKRMDDPSAVHSWYKVRRLFGTPSGRLVVYAETGLRDERRSPLHASRSISALTTSTAFVCPSIHCRSPRRSTRSRSRGRRYGTCRNCWSWGSRRSRSSGPYNENGIPLATATDIKTLRRACYRASQVDSEFK
jgi:predicted RNA-binding Zn-ribbon protein involved in translation (DUF1610 family)